MSILKHIFYTFTFVTLIFSNSYIYSNELACPWIPTIGKSVIEIQNEIKKRTGKIPNRSCGGGTNFKVCHECVDRLTDLQWQKIQKMLAHPNFRSWHRRWHQNVYDEMYKLAESKIGRSEEELIGENFLFYHREVYRSTQANLAAQGLPCILPWTKLPNDINDKIWPSDDAIKYFGKCQEVDKKDLDKIRAFLTEKKKIYNKYRLTQAFLEKQHDVFQARQKNKDQINEQIDILLKGFNLKSEFVDNYSDCANLSLDRIREKHKGILNLINNSMDNSYLKATKLGIVGKNVDESWHGPLHFMYGSSESPSACKRDANLISCQSMLSSYESHVNIHFYKAHGLIDVGINRWLTANGYEIAETNCKGKSKCFEWKGIYVGTPPDFVSGVGCNILINPKETIDLYDSSQEHTH